MGHIRAAEPQPRHRFARWGFRWVLSLAVLVAGGCDDCPTPNMDLAVCDPSNAGFTIEIDNPYFPLAVGDQLVLESGRERVQITTLDQTEVVAGVTTRVVEEREWTNDKLVEVSRNYFVQAADGTVCYFGEAVDDYRNGEIVGHGGEWRAGEGDNRPGIIMPATPTVGQIYYQEEAPGTAHDMAEVLDTDATVTTPAGTFEHAVEMRDCNPSTGGTDAKVYVRDIGVVQDANALLTSY